MHNGNGYFLYTPLFTTYIHIGTFHVLRYHKGGGGRSENPNLDYLTH
jgi:hypothetical protein